MLIVVGDGFLQSVRVDLHFGGQITNGVSLEDPAFLDFGGAALTPLIHFMYGIPGHSPPSSAPLPGAGTLVKDGIKGLVGIFHPVVAEICKLQRFLGVNHTFQFVHESLAVLIDINVTAA